MSLRYSLRLGNSESGLIAIILSNAASGLASIMSLRFSLRLSNAESGLASIMSLRYFLRLGNVTAIGLVIGTSGLQV